MRRLLRVPLDRADVVLLPDADALLLDLGAAEAPGNRAARRRAILDILSRARSEHLLPRGEKGDPSPPRRPMTVVGVAPLASGLVDADLDAVMAGGPEAVLLPGAVGRADLQHLAAKLAVREAEHGLAAGRTGIVAAPAGTAAGVLALGTLLDATARLRTLVWDPAPLARALGTGLDASPVRTARDLLLFAAAACRVPVLDVGVPAEP